MDYDKARKFVTRMAKKVERYYDEEIPKKEKQDDIELASELRKAVEVGGALLIDIAESLNRANPKLAVRAGRKP